MSKFNGFADKKDIASQFAIDESDLYGYDIIVAVYEQGGYDGDAYILLEKDHELFEVHGGHCSCHGLEGQFSLEPVTEADIVHRIKTGGAYYSAFGQAIDEIINHFKLDKETL